MRLYAGERSTSLTLLPKGGRPSVLYRSTAAQAKEPGFTSGPFPAPEVPRVVEGYENFKLPFDSLGSVPPMRGPSKRWARP